MFSASKTSGPSGYNINNSVRLRRSAAGYLSRTPATSNRKTWTWSGWVKRGLLGNNYARLFAASDGTGNNEAIIGFQGDNTIAVYSYIGAYQLLLTTTQVFRDSSAWYHVVVALDTTQATAANRCKVYINGSQVTAFGTATYPAQNYDGYINLNQPHALGFDRTTSESFDGYMAEVNFIDGQALTPSSFGSTNATTGVWQPVKYTGTYGTNGFYLQFSTISLGTLLSTAANISAPFGGVATNALVADGVYCTSNTSTGSAFTFLLNDFGSATQVTRYVIANLYFTGGVSTFSIQGSSDNSSWTTFATLSVTGSPQNFSGSLNGYFRYWRLAPTAFGTNGQANVDQFVLYQDGIGLDSSPNGNNWTPNNISVTAGTTYDAMTDSPTLTSATVANYAVLNPLTLRSGTGTVSVTTSNANLTWNFQTSGASPQNYMVSGTIGMSSGKWYWEMTPTTITATTGLNIGIGANPYSSTNFWATDGNSTEYFYVSNSGNKGNNGSSVAYGSSYTVNDVIGVALDMDAGTLTFYKNNVSQGTAFTGLTGTYFPFIACPSSAATDVVQVNFGQRPFTYTPPTGFNRLNTYNLPTSAIVKGNSYMDATLYTGNGSSQSITNAASFRPDFVWLKARSIGGYNHILFDSIRGATKYLSSNQTVAETTNTGTLTSFNSNGFSVSFDAEANGNTQTFVGWQWQAGQGTTSSNTNGSITSTVSVNTTAGFSVVTYTGTGSNATVGHGLGVAPKMVIVKIRNGANNWFVWHTSLTSGAYYLNLDATSAQQSNSVVWNNTIPTSSVFSLGTSSAINGSTNTYVAYCWAEIAGFSKFTSYTGNGSSDGPFIYCGFRPKFIIIKMYSGAVGQSWALQDTSRSTYNASIYRLQAESSNAENSSTSNSIDILSNGFKIRTTDNEYNNSSYSYIVAAFAENPFKNALAR